jgi:hypothetical protein
MTCKPFRSTHRESKIRIGENGRFATFCNPTKETYYVIQVDRGLAKNNTKSADYVLSKRSGYDLIIEFKGADVDHACKQIEATIDVVKSCRKPMTRIAGLIVSTRSPALDTRVQLLKNRFKKNYNSKLKVSSGNREHRFSDFF